MADTPVSAKWDGTNLNFFDAAGGLLFTVAGTTRKILTTTELNAALITASASYIKTKNNTTTLLPAHATSDRAVMIVAYVDETLASVGGSAPQFAVGETTTGFSCFITSARTAAQAVGVVIVGGGVNTATKALTVTGTAADGTSTGGITVTAIAIPIS